jgi:hypothetical protein
VLVRSFSLVGTHLGWERPLSDNDLAATQETETAADSAQLPPWLMALLQLSIQREPLSLGFLSVVRRMMAGG